MSDIIKPDDVEVRGIRQELAVSATDVARVVEHKKVIEKFVREALKPEIDYTTLNGRVEKFLTKPGAEKLKMLFGLGVRFRGVESIMDREGNFALFTYEAEVYHLKSGLTLAQCIGTCNSQEKKYRERSVYEQGAFICKEPTPIYDILNTLMKMAQKRAFVGAVILAVGASDYLTQDDDEVEAQSDQVRPKQRNDSSKFDKPKSEAGNYIIKFGEFKNQKIKDVPVKRLEDYLNYLKSQNDSPRGVVKEFIDRGREYLRSNTNGEG